MTPRTAKSAPSGQASLTIDVAEDEPSWTCLSPDRAAHLAAQIARAVAPIVDLPAARVTASLTLSSDSEVRRLNAQWRGLDKPTNVLSFPMPPSGSAIAPDNAPAVLGDVIIAEATLVREAAESAIPIEDHFRHLVLHGMLHLLGYDHESDPEADAMEALETRILASLGIPDPYADSEPVTASPSDHSTAKPTPRGGRASTP